MNDVYSKPLRDCAYEERTARYPDESAPLTHCSAGDQCPRDAVWQAVKIEKLRACDACRRVQDASVRPYFIAWRRIARPVKA